METSDKLPYREKWQLEPGLAFLNHGSFGACPREVLQHQRALVDLAERDPVLSLIDGAHGPGAIPLDRESLAPDYYVANCHKWLCSPRGAAFLFARPNRQARDASPRQLQPSSVSHGYNTQGPLGEQALATRM